MFWQQAALRPETLRPSLLDSMSSWLPQGRGEVESDFFSHMLEAMAEGAQGEGSLEQVHEYEAAVALCPQMVRAQAKLLEVLVLLGAKDLPGSDTRRCGPKAHH